MTRLERENRQLKKRLAQYEEGCLASARAAIDQGVEVERLRNKVREMTENQVEVMLLEDAHLKEILKEAVKEVLEPFLDRLWGGCPTEDDAPESMYIDGDLLEIRGGTYRLINPS